MQALSPPMRDDKIAVVDEIDVTRGAPVAQELSIVMKDISRQDLRRLAALHESPRWPADIKITAGRNVFLDDSTESSSEQIQQLPALLPESASASLAVFGADALALSGRPPRVC